MSTKTGTLVKIWHNGRGHDNEMDRSDLETLLDSLYIKEDSNLKIATGIEGYLNFCEQIEVSYGGNPWTDERKQKT